MTGDAAPPWYRRLSLRARMIIMTAGVVAGVLAVGGYLILVAVRAELVDAADEVGAMHAADLAEQAATGDLPSPVPVFHDPEAAVQVVSEDGRILTADATATRHFGLSPVPPGEVEVWEYDSLPVPESGPYRVIARGVTTPSEDATIYVAISIEDVADTMATATEVGAIGLLLLLLVLCSAMWVIIGTTLAPVERIRQQASAISGRHLDRRVLEPVQRDEIGRLARTVNAMLARLQDSAERQNRFVEDAAHELRSPVTSLRTQLETARNTTSRNGAASVSDLLQETLRMQGLVDRLLLLSRTDADELVLHRTTVDLDDTVNEVVTTFLDTGVSVDASDVHPAQVNGDPVLLEQVVRNLVENAVRHADSRVRICLEAENGQAVLTVDDDGPGIPVERRDEAFRRFARLDAARDRDSGGVGLGLAIVAGLVEAHSGSIEVDSAPMGGARLRVRLPLAG